MVQWCVFARTAVKWATALYCKVCVCGSLWQSGSSAIGNAKIKKCTLGHVSSRSEWTTPRQQSVAPRQQSVAPRQQLVASARNAEQGIEDGCPFDVRREQTSRRRPSMCAFTSLRENRERRESGRTRQEQQKEGGEEESQLSLGDSR